MWPDPSYIWGKLPTNARSTTSEEKLNSEGFTPVSSTHLVPLLTEQGEKNKLTPPPHTHTQVTTDPSCILGQHSNHNHLNHFLPLQGGASRKVERA